MLPYWKIHKEAIPNLDTIIENSNSLKISKNIIDKYSIQDFNEEQQEERPDIFISHSWNGPDAELVDPLVQKLKEMDTQFGVIKK
ncbi:MAG: hypothetical protein ACTSRZ_16485 [Promethearchaeota archaeon]